MEVLTVRFGENPRKGMVDPSLVLEEENGSLWHDNVVLVAYDERPLEIVPFNRIVVSDLGDVPVEYDILGSFFLCSKDEKGNYISLEPNLFEKYSKIFTFGKVRHVKPEDIPFFYDPQKKEGYIASCIIEDIRKKNLKEMQWKNKPEGNQLYPVLSALASAVSRVYWLDEYVPYFIVEKDEYMFFFKTEFVKSGKDTSIQFPCHIFKK